LPLRARFAGAPRLPCGALLASPDPPNLGTREREVLVRERGREGGGRERERENETEKERERERERERDRQAERSRAYTVHYTLRALRDSNAGTPCTPARRAVEFTGRRGSPILHEKHFDLKVFWK